MKNDLIQNISQFFFQIFHIFMINGIYSLIGFLNQIRPQCFMCLYRIPWTAIRSPKGLHDPAQPIQ